MYAHRRTTGPGRGSDTERLKEVPGMQRERAATRPNGSAKYLAAPSNIWPEAGGADGEG